MVHELPKLEYDYEALEPYIDAKTMEIHHSKHHQSYVDKLNKAIENYPELQELTAEELIANLDNISQEIREVVRNNGGGHANHSFFWKILKKDVPIDKKEILTEIENKFTSFENFKEIFSNTALSVFGSGWAWLVLNNNELEIIPTKNQDSPISNGMIPLIAIDVWEHAYYLKYQNRRAEYIKSFFNVINWDRVNELFLANKR